MERSKQMEEIHMGNKGVSWTEQQQQVIDAREKNILVSAAAGSGKTAVLVERIITMVSQKENPVDIDKLLVVTFTNAAAAEMSERILQALEKKAEEESENMHLRKQITLVKNAHICTFHSFCQSVIRNHFNEIELDPNFRIGDDTELQLMKNDVMEALFEEKYKEYREEKEQAQAEKREMTEEEEAFINLVECYAGNKNDDGLRENILQLYHFAMSSPWPEEWLEEKKKMYEVATMEELNQTDWMKFLLQYLSQILEGIKEKNRTALRIAGEADGPEMYLDALLDDEEYLEALSQKKSYEELGDLLAEHKWKRLSTKKSDQVSAEKREQVKSIRDEVKKTLADLSKQFFFQSSEQMLSDMQEQKMPMCALLDLTMEFKRNFQCAKEEKRVLDFNDLEHYALAILVDGEEHFSSAVAKAYSQQFVEILVDEYQDSNEVQETILQSICQAEENGPSLFMVGDVKQSIYKFRMARPELFMGKYAEFPLQAGAQQKLRIDLSKNFRSRGVVLESVNRIFQEIMRQSLGGVEYDEAAALYLGNKGFPQEEGVSDTTELLLFCDEDTDVVAEEGKEEEQNAEILSAIEVEARMVASRIQELVDQEHGLKVVDKKTGLLRKCEYEDIVILLRTMNKWSDGYLEVLKNAGIPVYTETRTGYFSTYEIRTVLQYLKVLDNPRQDIPLAAVMRSMFGKFTAEEMAVMRNYYQGETLYDTIKYYKEEYEKKETGLDANLGERIQSFLFQIETFRERIPYTPIHQLLEEIYEETGYADYVSVMPNGAQRKENLKMLINKALDLEATNQSTLFHFNRYIEKLHKYEVDFGEALGADSAGNAVQIMSIHKSKGLEFPVVIVGAMSKKFNNQDAQSRLVLQLDYGVGADVIDYKMRTKIPSLIKKTIARKNTLDNLGEELRVLYVALTRAKEKLIMAGVVEKEEKLDAWKNKTGEMDYFTRVHASSYADWVAPIIMKEDSKLFSCNVVGMEGLVQAETLQQIQNAVKKSELNQWNTEKVYQKEMAEKLKAQTEYKYAFENEKDIKSKMTVSELKLLAMQDVEETGVYLLEEQQEKEIEETPLPQFLKQEEPIKGANRGTIYHRVFEKIRFEQIKKETDILTEIEWMQEQAYLTKEEANAVYRKDIFLFVNSKIGQRMRQAEEKGKLWREQPFVIGLPAGKVKQEWKGSQELVLIQGIIDAYFIEEDEIVLVDYKTDWVNSADVLVQKYKEQLAYYQRALEQMTGKKVKEKIIYSVSLGTEVPL